MHPLFLTPELLLAITSFLPPSSLTTCLLVSRTWRNILKNNLPPQKRPLPDTVFRTSAPSLQSQSSQRGSCELEGRCEDKEKPERALPLEVILLAQQIKQQDEVWSIFGSDGGIEDAYFFYREGACRKLLNVMSPFLHPFLSKHAVEVVAGIESLAVSTAGGFEGVCVRTKCTAERYCGLLDVDGPDDEHGDGERWVGDLGGYGEYIMHPPVKSVEVYCVQGAEWDLSYGNVLKREDGGVFVRVERERGVRMGDFVEEVRGVLVVGGVKEDSGDRDIVLEWMFDGGMERE